METETVQLIAKDIFGNAFEPGDFFLYCPGSKRNASLKMGIFIDVIPVTKPKANKSKADLKSARDFRKIGAAPQPQARVKLLSDYGYGEVITCIDVDIFAKRAALYLTAEFTIDSNITKRAIQVRDDMRDSGLIGIENERVSINNEGTE